MPTPAYPDRLKNATRRVLVLDVHSRAAIESAYSLKSMGLEVHVAGAPSSMGMLMHSPDAFHQQPHWHDQAGFIAWLRDLDQQHSYDLIVPATEYSLLAYLCLTESDPLFQKSVLPPLASLRTTLNKHETLRLARELAVPIPATTLITSLEEAVEPESFPVVLKPVHSVVNRQGV